jgi:hypothetical protein
MKRNKRTRRERRRHFQAVKGGAIRLRKLPKAAIEPDAAEERYGAGAMRFDSEKWRLPEALVEVGEADSSGPRPGRLILVISILAVVFIAIMTWFVSQMPEK